jgi:hypothetical protein
MVVAPGVGLPVPSPTMRYCRSSDGVRGDGL